MTGTVSRRCVIDANARSLAIAVFGVLSCQVDGSLQRDGAAAGLATWVSAQRPSVHAPAAPSPGVPRPRDGGATESRARVPFDPEPLAARYRDAGDLYAFLQELLPGAEAGERDREFYIYLILGRCQIYLRLSAEEARSLEDHMMLALNDASTQERVLWEQDYRRCRGFAGGDLSGLRAAMGDDLPGAEAEYGSVWFWRAEQAGYPPALAESAMRVSTDSGAERTVNLEEAVASGDPEVYWTLFYHSPTSNSGSISPNGLAWLILACGAGLDCTSDVEWFRDIACVQGGEACTEDESAIEHYWHRLSPGQCEEAVRLAARIEQDRHRGRYDSMPWPDLAGRNAVQGGGGSAGG